ncbi:MAG: hypothetical protein ACI8W8_001054 [Rhodothermales bacterium]
MSALPEKLSELLTAAINDLEACESADGYSIDMNVWHQWDGGHQTCAVCLAGAVMAQSLEFPQKRNADFGNSDLGSNMNALDVLDDISRGRIADAVRKHGELSDGRQLAVTTLANSEPGQWLRDHGYAESAETYKAQLRSVAEHLAAMGL